MTSWLEDWCAFCEGRASFDKSHFLGLLKACRDPEAIRQVFRYFPDADEMSRRAWDVISSGTLENALYLLPGKECGLAERLTLGEAWLCELARVCEAFGDEELAAIFRTAKVVAATCDEVHAARMQAIPELWVFDRLGVHERRCIPRRPMGCMKRFMGWPPITTWPGTSSNLFSTWTSTWLATCGSGEPAVFAR
ncbi:hypothetical protein N5C55_23335 [Pseudomonas otitidis]|uniref:hypothetical protein n=1 Tax=Metapseudomonas otitidis TaxID=319939 RepID=UPI002447CD3D|nr:hypothetical protein [Pseudomonas otitidis]MDH1105078.1 hypothetical protein [Pseudomonas otitidis]MDH1161115.1 hypothetical protein [Pseudomonas otitidis]MDH1164561.1 hypothetical protein [Pseudomonas otitidis]